MFGGPNRIDEDSDRKTTSALLKILEAAKQNPDLALQILAQKPLLEKVVTSQASPTTAPKTPDSLNADNKRKPRY